MDISLYSNSWFSILKMCQTFFRRYLLEKISKNLKVIYWSISFFMQGISYDHIELNFYINGKIVDSPITGIRGSIYPALYGKYSMKFMFRLKDNLPLWRFLK